jgi:hypothetical protein
MRFVDKAVAWLVCLLAVAHHNLADTVFIEPSER